MSLGSGFSRRILCVVGLVCGLALLLLVAPGRASALGLPPLPFPLPTPSPTPPALPVSSTPGATVQPYGTNDAGGFRNVLPPGASGFDNLSQLLEFEANKTYPPHSNDQLALYSNLTTAAPNITTAEIPDYFKDATFGVPAGDVESTESPEAGVTIVRDKTYGVPHIYGNTRAELMFGIGYATAEDRLFFIDALRHAGQGDLAQFAGGANVSMDEEVWANEPYTQQDLVNQVNWDAPMTPMGSRSSTTPRTTSTASTPISRWPRPTRSTRRCTSRASTTRSGTRRGRSRSRSRTSSRSRPSSAASSATAAASSSPTPCSTRG